MNFFSRMMVLALTVTAVRAMEQELLEVKKDLGEIVNDVTLKNAGEWIIDIHDFNPALTRSNKKTHNTIKAVDRSKRRLATRQAIELAVEKKDTQALLQIQNTITMTAFQELNSALDDMDAQQKSFSSRVCFWAALAVIGISSQLALTAYTVSSL